MRWLEHSHRAPGAFFQALTAAWSELTGSALKGGPHQGYDLYHALVARHQGRGLTALRVHGPGAGEERWRELSYDQLDDLCRARAQSWREAGVDAGVSVCVMLPPKSEAIIALLAGLRLGACVSLLVPEGPDQAARRLAALEPAFLFTDSYFAQWLDPEALDAVLLFIDSTPGPVAEPRLASHTYAPQELCAQLFSPLRRAPEQPHPLTAQDALRGAMRDAMVSLALRPGDGLAAPGLDAQQHQPGLAFAALIVGGAWVDIDEQSILADPALLLELPLRSLGTSPEIREALSEYSGPARPRWEHVFKNPEEPCDPEAWREFVELLGLGEVAVSNILFEAASGGALLSSARRKGEDSLAHLLDVSVAAGRAWSLLDFSASGQLAVGGAGVFSRRAGVEEPDEEGELCPPHYLVIARRRRAEHLYGGTLEPRRSGRVYPLAELLDCLADCPFLRAASLVALPLGGPGGSHSFVLIGFVGHEPDERFAALERPRVEELSRVIQTRLGRWALPDRVELFRGFARVVDGAVDHGWCLEQYVSGTLHRKHRSPVFRRLGALREALHRAEAAA